MTYAQLTQSFIANARKTNARIIECRKLGYHDLVEDLRECRAFWMKMAR